MSNNNDEVMDVETDIVVDKIPKKSRVSAKSTESNKKAPSKKKATNEEATAKRNAERERHNAACDLAADKDLVSHFPPLVAHNFMEHIGKTVIASVLETIENLQKVESVAPNGYNPFPASEYRLTTDPKSSREKAKPSVKDSVKPSSQPKIRRKGAKVQEPVESQDEEEAEETDMVDEVADEKAPTKAKKNIAQITAQGRKYLAMLICRATDESLDLVDGAKVKTKEDLAKYVYNDESMKETNKSQVLRAIVTAVSRLSGVLPGNDDKLAEKYLTEAKTAGIFPKNKHNLARHLSTYIAEYVRLVGYVIGQFLWVSKKQINHTTVEMAMRMLELGNHQYQLAHELCAEDEPAYSLSEGFFNDAREYLTIVMPPKPPVVRKGKKKTTEAVVDEPVEETKKAPARSRKPVVKVEYEEAEEEAEEEVEEDAEEEDEPEPEPPKKSTRTLKRST